MHFGNLSESTIKSSIGVNSFAAHKTKLIVFPTQDLNEMKHVLLLNVHQILSDKNQTEFYKTRCIMIYGFDVDLNDFVFLGLFQNSLRRYLRKIYLYV